MRFEAAALAHEGGSMQACALIIVDLIWRRLFLLLACAKISVARENSAENVAVSRARRAAAREIWRVIEVHIVSKTRTRAA